MTATDDSASAQTKLISAFNAYFSQVEAGGFVTTSVAAGMGAFSLSIAGVATANGDAATKIANAVTSFWSGLIAPSAFAGPGTPTAIVPPLNIGLAAAIQAAFDANKQNDRSLSDAAQAIADAIHGKQSGGILNYNMPPLMTPSTAPIT